MNITFHTFFSFYVDIVQYGVTNCKHVVLYICCTHQYVYILSALFYQLIFSVHLFSHSPYHHHHQHHHHPRVCGGRLGTRRNISLCPNHQNNLDSFFSSSCLFILWFFFFIIIFVRDDTCVWLQFDRKKK